MRWIGLRTFTALGVAALGSTLLLSACTQAPQSPSSAPSPGNAVVTVTMDEWHFKPSIASVPAGKVTFLAVNQGKDDHEVVILKTEKAAKALVVKSETDKVDEAASGDNVGEVEVEAGVTEAGTFNLAPGHYALICNVKEHYGKGMFFDFTVTGAAPK